LVFNSMSNSGTLVSEELAARRTFSYLFHVCNRYPGAGVARDVGNF
jgi:hypothetical protein